MTRSASERRRGGHVPPPAVEDAASRPPGVDESVPGGPREGIAPPPPGQAAAEPSHDIEPAAAPDGTFLKVRPEDHPLPRACEVTVYFQDYHRSSSKYGRFGKIVGMDLVGGEYLVMLDNFECVSSPMRRVEWRKVAT